MTHENEGGEDVESKRCEEGENDVSENAIREYTPKGQLLRRRNVLNALHREEERSKLSNPRQKPYTLVCGIEGLTVM